MMSSVKVITILHDKDGGFETVETLIEGDAVVMVNFPEGKMTVTTDGEVTVNDRNTGEDITEAIKKAMQQSMRNPVIMSPSDGLIGPTTCFFNGVAVPADDYGGLHQYVIQ
jgi:hypothetical protein